MSDNTILDQTTGALPQWIASLRVGDTLTVDDIHRFVRVELALRNADKHHQQARAMTAERDAAVRELDVLRDNLRGWMSGSAKAAKQYVKRAHEWLDRLGAEPHADYEVRFASAVARLAACERVVEQLRGLRAPSLCCDGENNDEVDQFRDGYTSALDDMRDILSAAVAAETTTNTEDTTV